MGRTARTYRNAVDIEEERWKPFRRTLKQTNQETLDRVFDYARAFADAGSMMVTPRITEVVLVAAAVQMLQEIDALQKRVKRLEEGT
jgi:hypothetical protein